MSNHIDFVWGPGRDALNWSLSDLFAPVRGTAPEVTFVPPIDLTETETHYVLNLDVPGIPKDAIKIELGDGKLSVSGERKVEKAAEKQAVHFNERATGKFCRTFELPKSVEADKIQAVHTDGVLRIEIPKAEKARPRLIEIKAV
jgi:HSP20 family protein